MCPSMPVPASSENVTLSTQLVVKEYDVCAKPLDAGSTKRLPTRNKTGSVRME